jgi:glyoxylase-like metal-dependent hydrolase (beta-lactamase superfamily II)
MDLDIKITGPIQVNTYILKDTEKKEAILIDVGGSFSEIKKELQQENYTIKYVLNTHGHFDHVLGDIEIQEENPEVPIYMSKDDISHIENLTKEMSHFGLRGNTKPLKLTNFIDENSKLYFENKEIKIFSTPGHSKGSLSYYIDGKVFVGDTLFLQSIGRTDFYDGDFDTLINSIKTKLLSLPEDTKVYPGHGPNTTISYEKKYNSYLK